MIFRVKGANFVVVLKDFLPNICQRLSTVYQAKKCELKLRLLVEYCTELYYAVCNIIEETSEGSKVEYLMWLMMVVCCVR